MDLVNEEFPFGKVKEGRSEIEAFILHSNELPWVWRYITVMDRDGMKFYDATGRGDNVQCMVLGS